MEVECAHCGSKQLMQIPGVWSPTALGDNGPMAGPAVPIVMLGCPQCGYIQMFSPQAVQPQPWPEQPAEQQQAEEKKG